MRCSDCAIRLDHETVARYIRSVCVRMIIYGYISAVFYNTLTDPIASGLNTKFRKFDKRTNVFSIEIQVHYPFFIRYV